jgi:hypothetical protein
VQFNLHQALRLKAPGGVENGLRDQPRRPAQHPARLFRRDMSRLPQLVQPPRRNRVEDRTSKSGTEIDGTFRALSSNPMGRNYLAGTHGDAANAVLAAAGFNFRRLLEWLALSWPLSNRRYSAGAVQIGPRAFFKADFV